MDNINKILLAVVIVLVIVLMIISGLYIVERKKSNNNLNALLDCAMEVYETKNEIKEYKEKIRKINFNINIIEEVASAKIDANSEEISMDELPKDISDIIGNVVVPEDYKIENCYGVYTRKNRTSAVYNVLHDYIVNYSKGGKTIKIAVSEIGEPLKDTLYEDGSEISELEGTELTVYQYENQYMADFSYNEKYFHIETLGLTEDLFLDLLESILSQK